MVVVAEPLAGLTEARRLFLAAVAAVAAEVRLLLRHTTRAAQAANRVRLCLMLHRAAQTLVLAHMPVDVGCLGFAVLVVPAAALTQLPHLRVAMAGFPAAAQAAADRPTQR